jgi:hypothetical protein
MSPYVGKLAPLAVVLATAVYCTVSGLIGSGSKLDVKPPAKLPEFTAALLSPTLPPASMRNPFRLPGEDSNKTVQSTPRGKKTVNAKAIDAKAVNANNDGLVLNATCIMGQQRLAVINGQVYRQKDTLDTSTTAGAPCVITEILPTKVLLESQGKLLQLSYSDVAAASEKTKKPAK